MAPISWRECVEHEARARALLRRNTFTEQRRLAHYRLAH
eukprot:COSAG02_NODE_23460_length_718_cov_0.867528_2_plen_38_part_01